jgi:hypothetical protein
MDVSREMAEQSLAEVQTTMDRTKKSIAGGAGVIMMIWGVIWMIGFTMSYFRHPYTAWIWLVLDMIGITASIIAGRSKAPVKVSSGLNWRIFFFWFFLFVFGDIWLFLLWPWNGHQLGAFIVTLVMFASVTMGLFYWGMFFFWFGLTVTALTLAGYFWLLPWFNLWMAFVGGGAFFVSGLYLWIRGRRNYGGA